MSYPFQLRSMAEYEAAYKKKHRITGSFIGAMWPNILQWRKKWDKVLEWNFKEPKVEWFKGGKLNITENCLDRHLDKLGDQPADYSGTQ